MYVNYTIVSALGRSDWDKGVTPPLFLFISVAVRLIMAVYHVNYFDKAAPKNTSFVWQNDPTGVSPAAAIISLRRYTSLAPFFFWKYTVFVAAMRSWPLTSFVTFEKSGLPPSAGSKYDKRKRLPPIPSSSKGPNGHHFPLYDIPQ